jgi:hypothetical protein
MEYARQWTPAFLTMKASVIERRAKIVGFWTRCHGLAARAETVGRTVPITHASMLAMDLPCSHCRTQLDLLSADTSGFS